MDARDDSVAAGEQGTTGAAGAQAAASGGEPPASVARTVTERAGERTGELGALLSATPLLLAVSAREICAGEAGEPERLGVTGAELGLASVALSRRAAVAERGRLVAEVRGGAAPGREKTRGPSMMEGRL